LKRGVKGGGEEVKELQDAIDSARDAIDGLRDLAGDTVYAGLKSIRQFVANNRIDISSVLVDCNPHMMTDKMPEGSAHWRCTLRRGRSRMTVYFSQGPAAVEEPRVASVLSCLADDASSVENAQSFEEWCRELGYDTDSRKAERTWKLIWSQVLRLKSFLGDAYETLLWKVERE